MQGEVGRASSQENPAVIKEEEVYTVVRKREADLIAKRGLFQM